MRFRFSLQKVLEQRKIEKDIAEREFQTASQAARTQSEKIKSFYQQIDEARAKSSSLVKTGGALSPDLNQIETFIQRQKIKIERENMLLRQLKSDEEARRESLIEAAREFKIFEKLKEKKSEEFRKEQIRKDHRITDEIVVTRAWRSKNHGS